MRRGGADGWLRLQFGGETHVPDETFGNTKTFNGFCSIKVLPAGTESRFEFQEVVH